jgi:hypothetical protein
MKDSIATLKAHNAWRRGDDSKQESPYLIGRAIDDCVKAAERYELLRTLTPQEFKQLWQDNINGNGYFDELVDKMIEARK